MSSQDNQPLKPLDADGRAVCFDAMVIWEHLVQHADGKPWSRLWDDCGTMAMREHCIDLAYHAELVWRSLSEEDQEANQPWDWEWIPGWLEMCVDWSGEIPVPITGGTP